MSLVGNLKTVSFSDLLQLISANKKTGMLSVARQSQKKSVFFVKGEMISFVDSDQDDRFLSQFLIRKREIDRKDSDRVLLLSKGSGKRIVDTLIEWGLVSRQDILQGLKILAEETVFAIFGWEEAEFEFVEGKLPPSAKFKSEMNTVGIIMEGAKRVDEWSEIEKILPPYDFSVKPTLKPPSEEGRVNLTLEEYQTLLLIDGQKTISEILLESPLGEFTTSKSLSNLISNGLIVKGEKKTPTEGKKEEEKTVLEVIYQIYHYCLSTVEHILTQKMGEGGEELLDRSVAEQKEHYPVVAKLSKRGFLEKENFFLVAGEIPEETRLHQLLDLLNSILLRYLKTLRSVLGRNVENQVANQIRKEMTSILKKEEWAAEKYQLGQEIFRVLSKV